MVRNPLRLEERKVIEQGIKCFLSYAQIAISLGRSASTISREAKRLGAYYEYNAEDAHKDFINCQKERGVIIYEENINILKKS